MIVQLVDELVGREFILNKSEMYSRTITLSDMLFIAPYNHQVNKLKQFLGDDAKVGSVDKFQGQEAPVVFLSMCASDAEESLRGIDFLFDKHRINVALSRAQCLVVIVASPSLNQTRATQLKQLESINLYNAVVHYATA